LTLTGMGKEFFQGDKGMKGLKEMKKGVVNENMNKIISQAFTTSVYEWYIKCVELSSVIVVNYY
jgi:hypothetical protein